MNQKPTNKTKTRKQKKNKGNSFLHIKTSKRGKINYFPFLKKIEIILIASFIILLKLLLPIYRHSQDSMT